MPAITNNQIYLFIAVAIIGYFIYSRYRAEGLDNVYGDASDRQNDLYYDAPASVAGSGADMAVADPTDNGMYALPPPPLTADDLLPSSDFMEWEKLHPSGKGQLTDRNFLTAGHHIGINTQGQSLRNANLQLRSEPPNPQIAVSPWQQATIGPDINRRSLEVGENTVTAYKI